MPGREKTISIERESAERWPWPFTHAGLTAGLRRYFRDTSIQIDEVNSVAMSSRRPSIGHIQGFDVAYHCRGGMGQCRLVLKEPLGTTRAGLAGAGRREVGVYAALAAHLPLSTPAMVVASPIGDWLVLEAIEDISDSSDWAADAYRQAIDALAELHDHFWNLGEDLDAFPWLSRPFDADFEVHVAAAEQAYEHIVEEGRPRAFATKPKRMRVIKALIEHAPALAAPLREEPATLLHGDYWPGNIAILPDEALMVYDWQLAGVVPGIMDLLVFVNKSLWWFGDLPLSVDEMVDQYRRSMAARVGVEWRDSDWERLWDHALMWRFLQEWVDVIAVTPEPLLATQEALLDQLWLTPVSIAVKRRLLGS
jgi:aminoglycoside phosphotransferase (APT) family kinase protein